MELWRVRTRVRLFVRKWSRGYSIEYGWHDPEQNAAIMRMRIRRWHPAAWWMFLKALRRYRVRACLHIEITERGA